jgi:deoxyribodipyrimidine photolyase
MTPSTQGEEGADEPTTTNQQKTGVNKYKVAAAAQDKRMQNIEENLETMILLQKQAQTEMRDLQQHQAGTKAVLEAVVDSCAKNRTQIEEFKEETENTLMRFRESLALLDQAMAKPTNAASPRRKIRRPTLPPEDADMYEDDDSDAASNGVQQHHHNNKNNKAPKSDDEMTVAAGGN